MQEAEGLIDADSDGLTLGRVRIHLGNALRAVGKREAAAVVLQAAVETMAKEEAPFYEAQARESLAQVKHEMGDKGEARRQLEQALLVYVAADSPRAEEVRSALARF